MRLALARPARRNARGPDRVAVSDPIQAATAAQLRYVSDERPGLGRVRRGKAFHYLGPDGEAVRDLPTLRRIRALAIPPAWTDVWICPIPHGHIQAVGRDARGRKQYRYHPRWRDVRDQTKYTRLIEFGRALPRIRERVQQDLGRPGLPREKVLATVLRLLETTLIRVGNEEYARQNHSYGLTTLRSQHVTVDGTRLRFEFRGKGGKRHAVALTDRRLARVVRRCQELPGYELFQYVNEEGQRQVIDSADVNGYLRDVGGDDFTAKDFRTWGGTVLAAHALASRAPGGEKRDPKRHLAEAIRQVARRLGNTAAICRKCYVHPDVIDAHLKRALASAPWATPPAKSPDRMSAAESAVLRLLESRSGRKLQNRGGRVHSHSLSLHRHAPRPQLA
jgi:DNA topoisomerase I